MIEPRTRPGTAWGADDRVAATVARNVTTRYLAVIAEIAVGLVLLPFNVHRLGTSAYGLWMLAASVTAYFSVLDLGYAGALVKFVAQYRARRDARGLNEILSTLFCVFGAAGALTFAVAGVLAFRLDALFPLTPEQAATARAVLLIVTTNVAIGFPFAVFGGVINGFQRYDLNNVVATVNTVAAAAANVAVLLAGGGLVAVVAATTIVRLLAYAVYRANAYRVFPDLRLRPSSFRVSRLREVTGFSVYVLILDSANKINYSADAMVIGVFLGAAAVTLWTIAQRLAEVAQRLTSQLNDVLFPTVVDSDASARADRLQQILIHGTALSLATVIPLAAGLFLLAPPLVEAWVGPGFRASVPVLQILALVVTIRVGDATAGTVLKGAGQHRFLAVVNSATAAANLLLSIALVGRYGLVGVAVGTLVPVGIAGVLLVFPAACRRVGLPVLTGVRRAVWPAAWPAVVLAAWLLVTRAWLPPRLLAVIADGAAAGLVYWLVFAAWGLDAAVRRNAATRLRAWVKRGWRVPAAA